MITKELTCVVCPAGCKVLVTLDENNQVIDVTGHTCPRGKKYAESEVTNPVRTLTSTVTVQTKDGAKMLPVRTDKPIPRPTLFEAMEIVRKTLNNVVNPDIVARLNLKGANARPLHGNWIFSAKKITAPDRGYVGEVVNADIRAVMEMLYAGVIPVVTPLGTGIDDGHLYNINADYAAAALAKALKVRKFALVSDVPGLMKNPEDPATLVSTLRLESVGLLKAEGVISGGMLPKIESCEDAIRAGVKKVHLVDGRMEHSLLLEIFTREGVGTEITE
jgi:acetylglutamate kinase